MTVKDFDVDVLDKIRAEIEQTAINYDKFAYYKRAWGLWIALDIIDKYRGESEDKCKNCKYYFNPDYTRCHECKAEIADNEMTREEALYKVKGYLTNIIPAEDYSEVEDIIKALEQMSNIEDIKSEIQALPKTYPFVNHIDTYVKDADVIKIIERHCGGDTE